MHIQNIKDIKNSKIRFFPFQTKDHAFILFQDLPFSYLVSLLVDKIDFSLNQFTMDYVYPFRKYIKKTFSEVASYPERYFVFNLENYYHSVDFALGFIELFLDNLAKTDTPQFVILHTFKTPEDICEQIMKKYPFVLCIVRTDLEYFFQELFLKNTAIQDIPNILFRDDTGEYHITKTEDVAYNLGDYIVGAYYNGYYQKFPKVKDQIIALVDDDDEKTNPYIYGRWPKKKFIEGFRYRPQVEAMLTSGRGCKYKCSYCYRGIKYSSVRQIPLDIIEKDLAYLQEYGYEYVYFYDDCFLTTNYNRLDAIIDLMAKYDFEYGIAARYEVCTSETLEKLTKIRIKRVQIGLQSASIEANIESKRGFKRERFQKTIQEMQEKGIHVSLDIILGLPGEGLKGFITTFNYAVSLRPVSIFINTLFLNPGTELYDKKEEYGIITRDEKYGERSLFRAPGIYSSNNFSAKDLEVARKYIAYYIEKIKDIAIILR